MTPASSDKPSGEEERERVLAYLHSQIKEIEGRADMREIAVILRVVLRNLEKGVHWIERAKARAIALVPGKEK